jgi:hypothetical protein
MRAQAALAMEARLPDRVAHLEQHPEAVAKAVPRTARGAPMVAGGPRRGAPVSRADHAAALKL